MKKFLLTLTAAMSSLCSYSQTFNPTSNIGSAGAVNSFKGGYTFAYATSGSPWNGALMSFGGFEWNNYDCQISTSYYSGNISFRTHNGDAGTWNPWFELLHSGNLNNSNSDFTAKGITASGMAIKSSAYSSGQGLYLGWNKSGVQGEANLVSNIGGGIGGFTFDNTTDGASFTRLMTILGNGNVGIGVSSPDAKLAVNGTIHTKEVKVDMNGWADYVFNPNYDLKSLIDVEKYIKENKHLPDMPSEQTVLRDGLNLGEMNKLLVKKVEELTLYLIEKEKQLAKQQLESKLQDNRITSLEKAILGLSPKAK
jgi:hypothetical protein